MRTHNLVVLLYRRKYLLLVEMFLTNFKRYEYGMCYLLVNWISNIESSYHLLEKPV